MYAALARSILDDTNRLRAGRDVERLRKRHPRASRHELAVRAVRRAALQCAAAGGLMTGPAAFFGAMPFGAGLAYQAVVLNRLVLSLAAIYGDDASGRSRATGFAAGFSAGLGSEIVQQALVRVLRRALSRRPGVRTVVGALTGGALGYAAAVAVGGFARDLFAERRLFARLSR